MSRLIKLTDEYINEIKADFEKKLTETKMFSGTFNYSKKIGEVDRKAKLYFEETAYVKMQILVQKWDKEIAWHGIAQRYGDDDSDSYVISDILVYPQEVTSATVETDQTKYQDWLYDLPEEQFNNLRMQGHSHVNMGVTPSSVDTAHQEKILEQLEDDMFYIFLIWNKKNDRTIKIYDMAKNILFETGDITVYTLSDGTEILDFVESAKDLVVDRKFTPKASSTSSSSTSKPSNSSSEPWYSSGKFGSEYYNRYGSSFWDD